MSMQVKALIVGVAFAWSALAWCVAGGGASLSVASYSDADRAEMNALVARVSD